MIVRRRVPGLVLATLMFALAGAAVSPDSARASELTAPTFQGLTPGQVLETRTGPSLGTVDGLHAGGGPIGPASPIDLQVTGRAGVPTSGVIAVALNVTAINPSHASFLTLWPKGFGRPTASNLNLDAGRTLPNAVVVRVGAGGQVSIWNDQGSTHLAIDVLGWWPVGWGVSPVNPARLVDTRTSPGAATVDGLQQGEGAFGPGEVRTVVAAGRGGVGPGSGGAVVVNITAVNPTEASFLTVWPGPGPRPSTSNLNLAPGRTLPNLAIVGLNEYGTFWIYNDQGTTHVLVDVLAWIPDNGAYRGLSPTRLADTRTTASATTVDGLFLGRGALGAATTYEVTVRGRGGVPAGAVGAVALNVTAINPGEASFVTVWPTGEPRPTASNLNLAAGRTLPNLVIVPLGEDGRISLYNDRGSTHLAVDVMGWFPLPFLTTVPLGGPSPEVTRRPSISGGGRFVAYERESASPPTAVFVLDRQSGLRTPVSVSSTGTPANGGSYHPAISADGRYVAFQSAADNLSDVPDVGMAVYRHDRVTGETVLVAWNSEEPSISADGRFVAFASWANDLVEDDTNGHWDVFVWDATDQSIERVSIG